MNSMNFNSEFQTLMRLCLNQGYVRLKGRCFLHPGKSHALNSRSDLTPRVLTLRKARPTSVHSQG